MTPRVRLVRPFALIGVLGAYVYAEAVGAFGAFSGEKPIGVLILMVLTPVVAGALGVVLDRHAATTGRGQSVALSGVLTLVAGVVNGIACGLVASLCLSGMGHGEGVVLAIGAGGIGGAIASVPYLVPMLWTASLARAVGRARPGSLVDRSDVRWVWSAVAPSVAVAAVLAALAASTYETPTLGLLLVPGATLALALALVVLDVRAWRVARRELAAGPPTYGEVLDLGVGSETVLRTLHARDAYRDASREVELPRGDPRRALEVLRARAAWGSGLAVASSLALVFASNVRVEKQRARLAEESASSAYSSAYASQEHPVPATVLEEPATRVLYTDTGPVPTLLGIDAGTHTAYIDVPDDTKNKASGRGWIRAVEWGPDMTGTTAGSSGTVWEWVDAPVGEARDNWTRVARHVGLPYSYASGVPLTVSYDEKYRSWVDARGAVMLDDGAKTHTLSDHVRRGTSPRFAPTMAAPRLAYIADDGALFVANAASAKAPKGVDLSLASANDFMWDPQGDLLYVVTRKHDGTSWTSCLLRVDARAALEGTPRVTPPLLCPHGTTELHIAPDPSGTTAALCDAAPTKLSCTWIDLANASIKGRLELEGATMPVSFGPNGLLVAHTLDGVTYASFTGRGDSQRTEAGSSARLDVRGGAWMDQRGTFVTLRPSSGGWELVAIDVDRTLDPSVIR